MKAKFYSVNVLLSGLIRLIRLIGLIIIAISSISCQQGTNSGYTNKGPDTANGLPVNEASLPNSTHINIAFSTYLGGTQMDSVRDVATDSNGNVYVTGGTESSDFPVTTGVYDPTFNGVHDIYVAKFDPNGNLIWSTFIGGPNYDRAYAIELDSQGYIYLAGRAGAGFPVTPGAFQTTFQGGQESPGYGPQDGFVLKLKPDGSAVLWASYFGTSDPQIIRDIVVDQNGDIYLGSGYVSGTYPQSVSSAFINGPQGGDDTIIAKIKSDGSGVLWARYVGGSGSEGVNPTVRVDSNGYAYIATRTKSTDAYTTSSAYDRTLNGEQDVYVAKFTQDGSTVVYGTYLGGSQDEGPAGTHGLAIDSQGNAYVAGFTFSSDFPITSGVFQTTFGGIHDMYVSKLSADGSTLLASTFVGGNGSDDNEGIDIDRMGNICISGRTTSNNFPITSDAFQTSLRGVSAGYFVKLPQDLGKLLYSTYFGGTSQNTKGSAGGEGFRAIAVDANSNGYLGGWAYSDDWPTLKAFQTSRGGDWDGVLVKFTLE